MGIFKKYRSLWRDGGLGSGVCILDPVSWGMGLWSGVLGNLVLGLGSWVWGLGSRVLGVFLVEILKNENFQIALKSDWSISGSSGWYQKMRNELENPNP